MDCGLFFVYALAVECSCHVWAVTFPYTTHIDQDTFSGFQSSCLTWCMVLVSSVRSEAYDCIKAYSASSLFQVLSVDEVSNFFLCHTFFDEISNSFHNRIIDHRCMFHDLDLLSVFNSTNTVYAVRSPYSLHLRAALLKWNEETCRPCLVNTKSALCIDVLHQNTDLVIHVTEPYFFESCIWYIIQIVQE